MLVRTMLLTKGAQRRQTAVLTIAVALPFVVSLLRTVGVFPVTGYAASVAMTYLPASLVMVWGVFKYQLLQAVPIGRHQLVEALEEGVLVVDGETRVIDANAAAARLLGRIAGRAAFDLQGKPLSLEAWPHLDAWLEAHASRRERTVEIVAGSGAERTHIAMKVMPVWGARSRFNGSITVFTDVTDMKRKERELRRSATTDGLTGAYNRTAFVERTNQLLAAANRLDQPFSLLVLDIDDFKRINDTYGHQVGDEALRIVADAVAARLDRTQLLGRIGGEEFAAALPGVDLQGAAALAESIRAAAAGAVVPAGGERVGATVSIGAAARGESGDTYDALFLSADRRLYYAKRSGRDRVEAGETIEVPSVVK
jgi:diguanylate cyclase (GGDEF)-like protein